MPYFVKFLSGYGETVLQSDLFERRLDANAFARSQMGRISAAIMVIVETDSDGIEREKEVVKL